MESFDRVDRRNKEEIILDNDDDEWQSMRNHWHRCVVDNNYEINDVYPFNIRRVGKTKNISEYADATRGGYVYVDMNGKHKYKHVIVAKQFIPNDDPINKTEVDHINNDRTDYHIENLRWTTKSENQRNRSKPSRSDIEYTFYDELPDTAEALESYGEHELDGVYIDYTEEKMYIFNGVRYRELLACRDRGNIYYRTYDIENKLTKMSHKQLFG